MPASGKEHARISFLYEKYLNETCSSEEAQEIVGILKDSGNDNSVKIEANAQWNSLNIEHKDDIILVENRLIMDRMLDRLHRRIRVHEEESNGKQLRQNKFFAVFAKVAAVIILPLLVYSKSKCGHQILKCLRPN